MAVSADTRPQATHRRHQCAPRLCRAGRGLGPLRRWTRKVSRPFRQVRLPWRRHLFVISGFVIPWSLYRSQYVLRDYPKFLLKRNVRLYPPYLASIAITILATNFVLVRCFMSRT